MKSKRYILVAVTVVAACLIAARLAMSIPDRSFDSLDCARDKSAQDRHFDFDHDRDRTFYAVEPEITTPEYKTDAARAIDAYERLMERYMDLTEGQLLQVGADSRVITDKLNSLDSRLQEISARLARIENKLGIKMDTNSPPQAKAAK